MVQNLSPNIHRIKGPKHAPEAAILAREYQTPRVFPSLEKQCSQY